MVASRNNIYTVLNEKVEQVIKEKNVLDGWTNRPNKLLENIFLSHDVIFFRHNNNNDNTTTRK